MSNLHKPEGRETPLFTSTRAAGHEIEISDDLRPTIEAQKFLGIESIEITEASRGGGRMRRRGNRSDKSRAEKPQKPRAQQRSEEHLHNMSLIAGGTYGAFNGFWDRSRAVGMDAALIALVLFVGVPAGLAVTWWSIAGLAIIAKISPFIGAYFRKILLSGVKFVSRVLGKKFMERSKDTNVISWFGWNFLDGMEEFSRVIDEATDRAIKLIPFGIGDKILKFRQRAEALLGQKPDPRQEAVSKEFDRILGTKTKYISEA